MKDPQTTGKAGPNLILVQYNSKFSTPPSNVFSISYMVSVSVKLWHAVTSLSGKRSIHICPLAQSHTYNIGIAKVSYSQLNRYNRIQNKCFFPKSELGGAPWEPPQLPGSPAGLPLSLVIPAQPWPRIQKNIIENSLLPLIQIVFTWICGDAPSSLILNVSEIHKHLNAYENEIIQMSLQMLQMVSQYSINAKKISFLHMRVMNVCK